MGFLNRGINLWGTVCRLEAVHDRRLQQGDALGYRDVLPYQKRIQPVVEFGRENPPVGISDVELSGVAMA